MAVISLAVTPQQAEDPGRQAAEDPGRQAVEQALRDSRIQGQIALELPGGASTRRFFRVERPFAESLIAMYIPDPSLEIQKARQAVGGASFVEVQRLLGSRNVRVPAIIAHHPKRRVLLVEDLGDRTLAEQLLASPETTSQFYRLAVSDLSRAQLALRDLPEDSIVRARSFDAPLLKWEMDHFKDWALSARGVALSRSQSAVFERAAVFLSDLISSWSRGFVHRDFQSRNLMVRGRPGSESLTWIDFQDAMLGPRAYDLVALLMDSYQRLSRQFVVDRLTDYAHASGCVEDLPTLLLEFDLLTVQRKLKDAGRFIFIHRKNHNDSFLKYVDSTIYRARSALHRVASQGPELGALSELLCQLLGPLPVDEPSVMAVA